MLIKDNTILKISENEVIFQGIIGVGGQGEIKKIFWKGKPAAAKNIYSLEDSTAAHEFVREIKVLRYQKKKNSLEEKFFFSSMKHKNIIDFIGVLISSDKIPHISLVTELLDGR